MKKNPSILFFIFLLHFYCLFPQDYELKLKDDLTLKSFDFLIFKISENVDIDSIQNIYIDAYLKKGKNLNSFTETSIGYYLKGINSSQPISTIFFDSAIATGLNNNNYKFFPQIFLEYGNDFYESGQYSKSFNKYMKSRKYADSLDYKKIFYAANVNIAYIKEITGEIDGAKNLYLQNRKLLNSLFKNQELYEKQLANYHSLAYAHLRLNNYDSTTFYNRKGYDLSKKISNTRFNSIFRLVEGIKYFSKGKSKIAKDSILSAYPGLQSENDTLNLAFCNLYLGKVFLQERDTTKALANFLRAESLIKFPHIKKIPELSEVYEQLWKISKALGKKDNELKYLTAYIDYENVLKNEYQELYPNIKKHYDIPILIKEKENTITNLKERNSNKQLLFNVSLFIIFAVVVLLMFQYFKSKYYQKKINLLIAENQTKQTLKPSVSIPLKKTEKTSLSIEVSTDILKKLSHFEQNHDYLDSNTTLNSLAEKFNTNSSYLSKVVNSHRATGFSKYLNNLRIEYIINELIKNETLKKYTIKAIAQEAGFNNPESFSKAFREKTDLYPSYFIKSLNKKKSKFINIGDRKS